jgi:thioredoxin reductase (NADPH)
MRNLVNLSFGFKMVDFQRLLGKFRANVQRTSRWGIGFSRYFLARLLRISLKIHLNLSHYFLFFSLVSVFSISHASAQPEAQRDVYPVCILGGGVGALTSAVYLARAGMTPLVIEGSVPGGAITQSPNVQNWPGEVGISGFELIEKMHKQAEFNGVLFRSEEVVEVDFSARPFTITTKDLYEQKTHQYKAEACIIALGTTPNYLEIPGEKGDLGYWGKGVYNCAVCDGALYKDKTVAIVGGGDAAIIEASYLSNIAKKVFLIVRKDTFRTHEDLRKNELLAKPNVEVLFHTTVQEVKGDAEHVTHVIVRDEHRHSSQALEVDALFLAIGSKPNSTLFQKQLALDLQGYILLKKDQQTSKPGVFAIGDIVDPTYKQAISAAGHGAVASIQVEADLAMYHAEKKQEAFALHRKEIPLLKQAATIRAALDSVLEVTSVHQFERELAEGSMPVFVDFYAAWCGPCKSLSPYLDAWAKTFSGKIKFLKVNVDKVSTLAKRYRISSMPTMLIFNKEGGLIERKIGSRDIFQYVKNFDRTDQMTTYEINDLLQKKE